MKQGKRDIEMCSRQRQLWAIAEENRAKRVEGMRGREREPPELTADPLHAPLLESGGDAVEAERGGLLVASITADTDQTENGVPLGLGSAHKALLTKLNEKIQTLGLGASETVCSSIVHININNNHDSDTRNLLKPARLLRTLKLTSRTRSTSSSTSRRAESMFQREEV
eukprot:3584565-Rhodomonas_salina.3